MTLTVKLDRNWSSFQLANSAPPLSVTDSAIAPSARIVEWTLKHIELNIATKRTSYLKERYTKVSKAQDGKKHCYPEGCAATSFVQCQCNTRGFLSKLKETPPQGKIHVTSKSPVGDISVVTLIRTDTTLDHSQKAEKVCQRKCPDTCRNKIVAERTSY